MTLKKYHQKRNFKKTPEPKGQVIKSKKHKKLLYIIQKHAASHLHYDFRLELNGVLLSWAVPKGPSLDPSVKRLAIHVEDHPLSYGSFEGTIPKGEYGGGTVMLWDKGEWICENPDPDAAYRKGHLTFQLKAKKLNGRWQLIRINKDDKTWLLMKIKDDYAKSAKKYDITVKEPNSVTSKKTLGEIGGKSNDEKNILLDLSASPFPKKVYPELATLVDEPPEGKNWLYEIKWDGYRFIAFKQEKKVRLMTRNQHDWSDKFKSIVNAIKKLPVNNLILDGEIVVLDKNQRSNFQLLQNAIKDGGEEFYYYIFDLLYYDKYNLISLSLIKRKNILEKLLKNSHSNLRYSDHAHGSGKSIFKKSCKLDLEGIIAKNAESTYSQTRDRNWLKVKCKKRQEFIIGGFQPSQKRKYFKSLMLGTFNKKHELIYHGNVGTGFNEESLKNIYAILSKNITEKMPYAKRPKASKDAIWLKPKLIAEIEFTEWTNDKTLRHPSFKGIRFDKSADSVTEEKEVPIKTISLTHPDKILYPENKITKQNIYDYYETIHEWILPYLVNRPLTLLRCPNSYKECFFQKHITHDVSGLNEILIKEKSGKSKYVYIKKLEGLLALPQMGVLEIHAWNSTIKKIENPDQIVFDLDPAPEIPWKKVVAAAFEIKEILEEYRLKSFVKTTGGKGLHVVVPIKPQYDWEKVKIFSKVLVDYMVTNNPEKYIGTMSKTKRKNKIFIDYLRNLRGATAIAPYSIRARKGAPVATPLAWDELTNNIRDTQFTMETVVQRLQDLKKDPWEKFFKIKQSLKLSAL